MLRNLILCAVLATVTAAAQVRSVRKPQIFRADQTTYTGVEAVDQAKGAAEAIERQADMFRVLSRLDARQVFSTAGAPVSQDRANWEWWAVQTDADYPALETVPLGFEGVRFVAEMRTPQSATEAENQVAELEHFRAHGYGGALVVWRGEQAGLGVLASQIETIRRDWGWRVLVAYGPAESSQASAYVDPARLRAALTALVPRCDGVLLVWRKASQPHWTSQQIEAYPRVIGRLAREIAPAVPILGEAYVEERGAYKIAECAGISAHLATNCGYSRPGFTVNPRYLLADFRATGRDQPLGLLVQGPQPYHATLYPTPLAPEQIAFWRRKLEDRALANGFAFTITLTGDGSDNREFYRGTRKRVPDGLTQTEARKTGKARP